MGHSCPMDTDFLVLHWQIMYMEVYHVIFFRQEIKPLEEEAMDKNTRTSKRMLTEVTANNVLKTS